MHAYRTPRAGRNRRRADATQHHAPWNALRPALPAAPLAAAIPPGSGDEHARK